VYFEFFQESFGFAHGWVGVHVTFRQLQVFLAVAQQGSYTRAAELLYLSQPAVSHQIRQLEENIGLPLFDTLGKRLLLTEAGQELERYARSILQRLDEAQAVLQALKGIKSGRLSIAVASTANHFATRLLARFAGRYPGTEVSLDVTNRKSLLQQLDANEPDLVIMGQPPHERDLETEVIMENPLVVIAPRDHALAGCKQIPLQRLQEEVFVVREQGSGTRGAMERLFADEGIVLRTGMEMTLNEAIKQAVEAGLGLGVVSLHTLELELETGRLTVLDVEAFPILRHWHVVHRRGKRLSPLAQAFKAFVLSEAQNCVRLPQFSRRP
jgi:DNA-binding transcriptional LysR family regulator